MAGSSLHYSQLKLILRNDTLILNNSWLSYTGQGGDTPEIEHLDCFLKSSLAFSPFPNFRMMDLPKEEKHRPKKKKRRGKNPWATALQYRINNLSKYTMIQHTENSVLQMEAYWRTTFIYFIKVRQWYGTSIFNKWFNTAQKCHKGSYGPWTTEKLG